MLRRLGLSLFALALLAGCNEDECTDAPGDLCLLVGTGEYGFNRDGLAGPDTDLYLPSAARLGPDGRVYVVDFNNQRLRRVDEQGRVETIAGSGFHAIATVGIPVLTTPLENPIDLAFDSAGRVVFVSYHDPRVLQMADDGTLRALAGAPDGITGVVGNEGDGGPAEQALFIQLDGLAITPDDVIYVSDSLANRVRKIEDGLIDTVAGTGEAAFSGDGGPGREAALHWPTALELDAEGNLYIADTLNHTIRKLALDGTITTVAGTGVEGKGGEGGPATMAQLSQPFGIALDPFDGSLYIGDRGNFRVRALRADGTLETIAGTGRQGSGDEGSAMDSPLGFTARLALADDRLLIADQSGSRIWYVVLR